MEELVFKDSFSVDDIHKLREQHYEKTKNMTKEERLKEISEGAEEFKRELRKRKLKSAII